MTARDRQISRSNSSQYRQQKALGFDCPQYRSFGCLYKIPRENSQLQYAPAGSCYCGINLRASDIARSVPVHNQSLCPLVDRKHTTAVPEVSGLVSVYKTTQYDNNDNFIFLHNFREVSVLQYSSLVEEFIL